ncbi:hypothetical protein CLV72_109353 [Allonocardiopsis opalescens]|uniref:Uncharacterized protein n=2 Tax=Allonocardiopsis opalescens TaxID=1144618 RepID=A0A2T0PWD5_9ACTN|nr:hypothetical protein CLV72_109353 [Allonocardiopsis opalescens]
MNSYPALNDHFDEAWVFFGRDLTARMPTFRDADRATVVAWLSSIDTELLFGERWAEPPDAVVDDLSRLWANGKAIGLSASAVRWLQAAFRDGDPSEDPALVRDRERFVALLKSAIPRLPWREAMQPIGVIWSLGHDRELEYFAALADDPALHPKTRAEAAHYREICEDERAAREAQEGGIE